MFNFSAAAPKISLSADDSLDKHLQALVRRILKEILSILIL